MKSIVITGGIGFIGSHFVEKCLKNEYNIYCIDNLTYAANLNKLEQFLSNDNFTFIENSIQNLDYLPDSDIVINFAAESHVDNSISNSEKFLDTNIKGVIRLLDLIKEKSNYKMPLYIQISTDEVYGDNKSDKPYTEEQKLNPSNPYAASKAAADLLILSYYRTHNVPFVIFRPTNNYGIGQHPEKLIPKSIQLLMRNKKIQLHGDGSFERCWLHVEDTCNAIYEFIEQYSEKDINQIYNISSDEFLTIKDVANYIYINYYFNEKFNNIQPSSYDSSKKIEYNYYRKGIDINYWIDDSKLRNLINWKPEKIFSEEIKKIVDYTRFNYRW